MKNNLHTNIIRTLASIFLMLLTISSAKSSELSLSDGVSFQKRIEADGQELVLNGAGFRVVRRSKLFALALYLPTIKTTQQEVLSSPGPIRLQLVLLKSVSSDSMSNRFLEGLHNSSTTEERTQLLGDMLSIGQAFSEVKNWNAGDVFTINLDREKGTTMHYNGKQVGQTLSDSLIMQVIMKIWIGDNSKDIKLKRQLLGDYE